MFFLRTSQIVSHNLAKARKVAVVAYSKYCPIMYLDVVEGTETLIRIRWFLLESNSQPLQFRVESLWLHRSRSKILWSSKQTYQEQFYNTWGFILWLICKLQYRSCFWLKISGLTVWWSFITNRILKVCLESHDGFSVTLHVTSKKKCWSVTRRKRDVILKREGVFSEAGLQRRLKLFYSAFSCWFHSPPYSHHPLLQNTLLQTPSFLNFTYSSKTGFLLGGPLQFFRFWFAFSS